MWLSFQSCSQAAQALRALSDCSDVANEGKNYSSCYFEFALLHVLVQLRVVSKVKYSLGNTKQNSKSISKDSFNIVLLFPDNSDCQNTTGAVELLEVKVGWEASTAVLEDIAIFKHTLCQLCALEPRFLVIRGISTTNFQMSWAFPSIAREKICRAIKLNSDTLYHQSKVHSLKMADFQLDLRQVRSRL